MFTLSRPSLMWLKRMGLAGVLFFLLKGVIWLSLPALLALRQCAG
jgi:hypothetical protein